MTTKRHWSLVLFLFGKLTLAQPSPASTQPMSQPAADGDTETVTSVAIDKESRTPAPFLDILHNKHLTGNWGGTRTDLEAQGITFCLDLVSIYQQNFKGGQQTHHGHRVTGSSDLQLAFCTSKMGLWEGGTLYLYAESGWGDAIDDRVGGLSGVNTDAIGDRPIRVSELWYEQKFLEDNVRLKFGKMDLTLDIDTNAYASWEVTQFLNGWLVNTGNIPLPDYGQGVVLSVQPTDWMYVTLATSDAQADGNETGLNTAFHDEDSFFTALETGLTPVWETAWGELPGGYRLIVWYDPQSKEVFFNDLDGRRRTIPHKSDDIGFAINIDQMVFKERPDDDDDSQGLGLFLRYGYADQACNEIEHFWSAGVQYEGLVPTRDQDVLGLGFAQGILSDQLQSLSGGDRESVYELYYKIQVLPWMHVTPDLQYLVHPGADKSQRDALVAGVRVVMTF